MMHGACACVCMVYVLVVEMKRVYGCLVCMGKLVFFTRCV